jgi:hypothetical protein
MCQTEQGPLEVVGVVNQTIGKKPLQDIIADHPRYTHKTNSQIQQAIHHIEGLDRTLNPQPGDVKEQLDICQDPRSADCVGDFLEEISETIITTIALRFFGVE